MPEFLQVFEKPISNYNNIGTNLQKKNDIGSEIQSQVMDNRNNVNNDYSKNHDNNNKSKNFNYSVLNYHSNYAHTHINHVNVNFLSKKHKNSKIPI
jgi:hypothetical protein